MINKFYLLNIFEQVPCDFLWFKSMSRSMLEVHSFVQASQPPLTILSVKYRHQVKDFLHWVGKGPDNLHDYFTGPAFTRLVWTHSGTTSVQCWYWCLLWFRWNWSEKSSQNGLTYSRSWVKLTQPTQTGRKSDPGIIFLSWTEFRLICGLKIFFWECTVVVFNNFQMADNRGKSKESHWIFKNGMVKILLKNFRHQG